MSVELREMTAADTERIAALEKECFAEPWTQGMLAGSVARADFCGLTLTDGNTAIGYICGLTLFEDGEIARVAVTPTMRGKGLGGKLLDAFLKTCQARGAQRVFLEVRVSNIPAVSLYQSRGFVQTRLRRRYYANGEDALEMVKNL